MGLLEMFLFGLCFGAGWACGNWLFGLLQAGIRG